MSSFNEFKHEDESVALVLNSISTIIKDIFDPLNWEAVNDDQIKTIQGKLLDNINAMREEEAVIEALDIKDLMIAPGRPDCVKLLMHITFHSSASTYKMELQGRNDGENDGLSWQTN